MDVNDQLFKGTSFSDLMSDVYHNSKKKDRQINQLISQLQPLIRSASDATIIVPLIKEYLDVAVKNDDQLVKIANVVTKILTAKSESADEGILTDKEKSQLLDALNEEVQDIHKKSEEIKNKRSELDDNNFLEN